MARCLFKPGDNFTFILYLIVRFRSLCDFIAAVGIYKQRHFSLKETQHVKG